MKWSVGLNCLLYLRSAHGISHPSYEDIWGMVEEENETKVGVGVGGRQFVIFFSGGGGGSAA